MPLPSFLQRKETPPPKHRAAPADTAEDSGPVQEARTRARRRLIGAVVLLAVGVLVFPLVFETQPRPIAVDTPIEVAGRPPTIPTTPTSATPATPSRPASAVARAPMPVSIEAAQEIITERAEPAAVAAPTPPEPKQASKPEPVPALPAKTDNGARARAWLEGGGAASEPKTARFVVQVGAFTEANALREARAKVEKLGLKTYTQVIDAEGGQRTRVRVGPFATRSEAEQTAATLKGAGLPAAILVL